VAKGVGVQARDPVRGSSISHNSPSGSVAQSFVESVEKQGPFRCEMPQPQADGVGGGWSKWHNPFFLAFAQNSHEAIAQVQVENVERDSLGDAQSSPIHQL